MASLVPQLSQLSPGSHGAKLKTNCKCSIPSCDARCNSGILVTKLFWNIQLLLQNINRMLKKVPWALALLLTL